MSEEKWILAVVALLVVCFFGTLAVTLVRQASAIEACVQAGKNPLECKAALE